MDKKKHDAFLRDLEGRVISSAVARKELTIIDLGHKELGLSIHPHYIAVYERVDKKDQQEWYWANSLWHVTAVYSLLPYRPSP